MLICKNVTSIRIALRKIRLVVVVPSPIPLVSFGCARKSPIEAPRGRVTTYVAQNAKTELMSFKRQAAVITIMQAANTSKLVK